MSIRTKIGVQPFVQNSLEYHWRFWCQPQVLGRQDGNDCHPAHLGAKPLVAPTPALHCSGGGITKSGKWNPTKSKGKYLFPVKAMSKVFRARFVAGLRKELKKSKSPSFYESLFKNQWVVYCKRPFFGPSQVIEYLGRYTHKIAISNHRIKSLESGYVRFMVKDYRHGGKKSVLRLSDAEFVRRFSLHILPKGFTRIRHYGILSSYYKRTIIPELQEEL